MGIQRGAAVAMAKKQTLTRQIWEAQQRRAKEKAAEEKKAQAEAEKAARAAARAAERARIAEEKRAQRAAEARIQRQEKADQQAVARVMREMEKRETLRVQQELKESAEQARTKERQARADAVQQRRDEALDLTLGVEATIAAIDEILPGRDRDLAVHRQDTDRTFTAEGASAYAERVAAVLAERRYVNPNRPVQVVYAPDSRRLTLNLPLPRKSGIPLAKSFKYVAARDEIVAEPRKPAEIRRIYQAAIARLTLCIADYAAAVTSPELVAEIAVNGHLATRDPATGRPANPCLVTFLAERARFEQILLDAPALDPVRCLHGLDARMSPNPYDLEAVEPIVDFDLERFQLADETGALVGLDARVDLMSLTPSMFESLIEKLFQAMGYNARKTRDSRDDGVDTVLFLEDLALGGICVIQVKRTKNTVPIDTVKALFGTMEQQKAHTGMVVTTSTFGPASYKFADEVGRIKLIDRGKLKFLLREHLDMDVLISSPRER